MVLVTKVIVRLVRKPEMVKTVLAIYESSEQAGDTVAESRRAPLRRSRSRCSME